MTDLIEIKNAINVLINYPDTPKATVAMLHTMSSRVKPCRFCKEVFFAKREGRFNCYKDECMTNGQAQILKMREQNQRRLIDVEEDRRRREEEREQYYRDNERGYDPA